MVVQYSPVYGQAVLPCVTRIPGMCNSFHSKRPLPWIQFIVQERRMIGQWDVSMTAAGDCRLQLAVHYYHSIPDHFFVSFSVVDNNNLWYTFGQDVEKAVHHPSSRH